jgi:hypothetical protein
VRSDSAGYQAQVVRVCQGAGVHFTITARKDDAVKETIQTIKKTAWRPYASPVYPNRETEVAETVHAFGDKDLPSYRLIVLRWAKEDRDLFDREPYAYHAVLTDREQAVEDLLAFHRARQDASENVNKEQIGGFGLSKLPCRELMANAAYFQIALLAHIVFAAFKHLVLPEGWKSFTIKTVRFRMIRLAGIVQRRARALWIKIPHQYPYRTLFEQVRWAVLGAGVWAT